MFCIGQHTEAAMKQVPVCRYGFFKPHQAILVAKAESALTSMACKRSGVAKEARTRSSISETVCRSMSRQLSELFRRAKGTMQEE